MKNLFLFIIALIGFNSPLFSQVGIGTQTPVASAILEVNSTVQGVLLSRMTSAQRIAIVNPAKGLMVFDTDANSLWYFNGVFWLNSQATASYGDVKSGIQSSDHDGWIKLEGRLKSSLSASQQAKATQLGIGTNLPNASNSYLAQNGAALGGVSSQNAKTIQRSQLPNVNISSTTDGAHSHSLTIAAGRAWETGPAPFKISYRDSQAVANYSFNTASAGDHAHTIALNGGVAQQTLDVTPQTLSVNMFIYLGL